MGVVKDELLDEKKNFGDERRTEIAEASNDFTMTDLIPDEPMTITLTKQNYIKRMDSADIRVQRKGGRGVSGMKMKDETMSGSSSAPPLITGSSSSRTRAKST